MKKLIFYLLVAIALFGCKTEPGFIVTDYKIINLIESDIVVKLKIDGQVTTIKPGDIRTIYSDVYHYKGGRPESSISSKVLELLEPEMEIDGEIIPALIWMIEYWKYDGSDVYNPTYFNSTYTLIVTDKLIEEINNPRQNAL